MCIQQIQRCFSRVFLRLIEPFFQVVRYAIPVQNDARAFLAVFLLPVINDFIDADRESTQA
ncbi:MAG TPA: hypothetical protein DC013_00315 [Ruminococcaceae bacterium]|nr:hypothetical protein [Oscillospiraceae bacterium]